MSSTEPFVSEHYPAGLVPDAAPALHSAGTVSAASRPLTGAAAGRVAAGLRERAASLRQLSASRVIAGLGRIHGEWAAPDSPRRAEAVSLLHRVTGYPPPLLDRTLRSLFAGMDAPALERWLEESGLAIPGVHVFGPELTVVVASGNIPGAALPSVVQALLLRSPCLVKSSSQEPVLLPLYARSLAASCPEVAQALAVTVWGGGDAEVEGAVLAQADALIAYGSDTAVMELRRRLPGHARVVGYGHRISFSAVGREWLTPERAPAAARLAARDIVLYDQQGCLSPQSIYVERGGEVEPEKFGGLVARSLAHWERRLPRRAVSPPEAAAIHQYRSDVEFRSFAQPEAHLWTSEGTRWTVVMETDSALAPCCVNRTAVLRPIDTLEDLPRWIAVQRSHLGTAAVAAGEGRRAALASLLLAAGVTRVATLGRAQEPAEPLFHDGVNALPTLARYGTVEVAGWKVAG